MSPWQVARLVALMIGLAIIVGSYTAGPGVPPPGSPPPANRAGPLPAECPSRIADADQAREALQRVRGGSLVCLSARVSVTPNWK